MRYDDNSIIFKSVSSCSNIVVVTRSSATKSRLSITLQILFHCRQLLHILVAYCVVYQRPSGWKGGSCGARDIAIGGGGHGATMCCAKIGWLYVVAHTPSFANVLGVDFLKIPSNKTLASHTHKIPSKKPFCARNILHFGTNLPHRKPGVCGM